MCEVPIFSLLNLKGIYKDRFGYRFDSPQEETPPWHQTILRKNFERLLKELLQFYVCRLKKK